MKKLWKLFLLVLVLIYIIHPFDLLPGFSVFGLIDDAFLMGLLYYYLRYKRLPGFLSWLEKILFGKTGEKSQPGYSETKTQHGTTGESFRQQTALKDPYEILGVTPGASKKEIQEAYRKAVQKYHPDKVAHLGDEFRELANTKFVEIQEAYDFLVSKKA